MNAIVYAVLLVLAATVGARDLYQYRQSDESASDGDGGYYYSPEFLAVDPTHGLMGTGAKVAAPRQAAPALAGLSLIGLLTPLLMPLLTQALTGLLPMLPALLTGLTGATAATGTRTGEPLVNRFAEQQQQSTSDDDTVHYEAFLVEVPGAGPCIVLAPKTQKSLFHFGGPLSHKLDVPFDKLSHHYKPDAVALGPVSLKPFKHSEEHDHDHDHKEVSKHQEARQRMYRSATEDDAPATEVLAE